MLLRKTELVMICFFVLFCSNSVLSFEKPNEQDIQLAAEKMEKLRKAYGEYEQAIDNFLAVNRETNNEIPGLAAVEAALLRINEFESQGLPGREKYKKWSDSFKDAEKGSELYGECRHAFTSKAWDEILNDPNWSKLIKPSTLWLYRHRFSKHSEYIPKEEFQQKLQKHGYTVFDPTDPNDEQLWKNIKRFWSKRAEDDRDKRLKLVEDANVPEYVVVYVKAYQTIGSIFTPGTDWLRAHTSRDHKLVKAAELIEKKRKNLYKIYQDWREVRHLLTDEVESLNERDWILERYFINWNKVKRFLSGEIEVMNSDNSLNYQAVIYIAERVSDLIN